MASTKSRGSSAAKSAQSSPKTAGKPVQEAAAKRSSSRKAAAGPSPAELDLRDRLKAQPRRAAGPPLIGDVVTREAMKALRDEVLPETTDPKGRAPRGSGKRS